MNSSYSTETDRLPDYFPPMQRKVVILFSIHDKMTTLSRNRLRNSNIVIFHKI